MILRQGEYGQTVKDQGEDVLSALPFKDNSL